MNQQQALYVTQFFKSYNCFHSKYRHLVEAQIIYYRDKFIKSTSPEGNS